MTEPTSHSQSETATRTRQKADRECFELWLDNFAASNPEYADLDVREDFLSHCSFLAGMSYIKAMWGVPND